MKKRVIGLLLALMLLMSLLPAGAMASGGEEDLPLTELWVDGVDILTATNNTVTCGSGTASYDADSNTLTLTNAKITNAHRDGFGIFATGDLTISLSGASNISSSEIEGGEINYGIEVIGSLTINGSGSLTVTGSRFGIMVGNPSADNNLTIRGNGVTVTANGNDSAGIAVEGSLTVVDSTVIGKSTGNSIIARSITVTGGRVTGDDGSVGISAGSMTVKGGGSVNGTGTENGVFSDSITVTGGTVTGEGSRYGIQAGEIKVSGEKIGDSIVSGSVTGTGTGNYSQGIFAGSLEVTGGSVIGKGSSSGMRVYDFDNTATITIRDGGSVTATSTTAGYGIEAKVLSISIDDTSTLTASTKFGGYAVACDAITLNGEPCTLPEEITEKLTVEGGKCVWEEVEREITLYVNGVNIMTAENNTVNCGSGTATYDTETKVLTLDNAEITSAYDDSGIYTDYNLTIELEGSSTISGNSITNGIKVAGDLTINGSGSLETTGSSAGISASGSLSIDGASTVTASSTGSSAPVSCSSLSVADEECKLVEGASVFKAKKGVVTWITNVGTLWVDGVNMTTAPGNTVDCGGGTASYDPDTNTLTLSGANISAPYTATADDETSISYGIYAEGDLNIVLNGDSTINSGMNHGVYVTGSLTITGTGSLTATGSDTGIFVDGPMKVTGGSVTGTGTAGTGILAYGITVTGGSISGTGDKTSNGITSRGDMTVSGGGSVRGEGNYAVYVGGNITVSDANSSVTGIGDGQGVYAEILYVTGGSVNGSTTRTSGSAYGIFVNKGMQVEGGTVDGNSHYVGIQSNGNMEVSGGIVTGDGNLYGIFAPHDLIVTGGSVIGTSAKLGIFVASLQVNGGNVEGTANGSDEDTAEMVYGITAQQGMQIQNGSVTGTASSAGTCYGLSTTGGSVYIDNNSTVKAESSHGNATNFSSFTVNGTEYTPSGASLLEVKDGVVVTGAALKTPKTLYVNGVDILTAEGYEVQCGSGKAVYDPTTNTLTLSGANITEPYSIGEYYRLSYGIYADGDLNINLVGNSIVKNDDDPLSCGVYVNGDLTVNGNGSLDATGSATGVYISYDLTVEGCTITGTSYGGNELRGIYASSMTVDGGKVTGYGGNFGINISTGNLTVEDGEVSGTSGTADSDGAYDGIRVSSGEMIVSGSSTVTGTGYDKGISIMDADGRITISEDSSVTAESVGENGYGLYAANIIITDTPNVTATSVTPGYAVCDDNITVNDAKYTLPEDATEFKVVKGVVIEPATEPEDVLYVNGVNILKATGNTVTCDEGGTATYDPNTNTLTLSGAKITETYQQYEGLGIFAKGDLNIELVGTSTVGSDQLGASVYIGGNLTISGTGSLEATGARNVAGFYVCNNMTVNSGTVIGNNSSDREGIYVSGDMIVNSGGIVRGTSAESSGVYAGTLTVKGGSVDGTGGYEGINAENSITVYDGTVSGIGKNGIFSAYMTVNGGTVSGTGTGTGTGWGVYSYALTMTGGTVTGEGENAAIAGISVDSVEASAIIKLPAGYLPEGYELQTATYDSYTCVSIVPTDAELGFDEDNIAFIGAAKEVTLKDWQGENPEQPTTPTDPTTPIIPAVPTTPSKDPSQQAVDKIESAQGGETVSVDLTTGKAELDKEVFEELSGKDTTLEVKLPGGVTWTVNGKDIPADADLTDLDLSVAMDTKTIPEEVINSVNSEAGTMQFTVKNDGEFGFTMTLTAPVGAKNAGMWANLYQYDEAAGKLVYQASALVDRNGYASLPVGSAGQYAIVLDSKSHALPFTDLAAGAWYEDAVAYVYRHDLMSGFSEDLFGPNADLSRAQLCQILYNMEGRPAVTGGSSFSDLADGAWYTDAVTWAASQGIVDGYGGGLFGPDDNITREQLASILYRYAQARGDDVSVGEDTNILSYSDAADVAEYAISAMQWACGAGVITGISESALAPRGEATRAQTAAMLMRFCEQYVEW